jgi:hypothetical protein
MMTGDEEHDGTGGQALAVMELDRSENSQVVNIASGSEFVGGSHPRSALLPATLTTEDCNDILLRSGQYNARATVVWLANCEKIKHLHVWRSLWRCQCTRLNYRV